MKTAILATVLFITGAITANKADAQLRVNLNVNIGSQPAWGPRGYDYVEYYYLPDIDCYYYVPRHQFVYLSNGRWTFSASLPYRYYGYNLYSGYKVVVNRPHAYYYYEQDRQRYGRGRYYGRDGGYRHPEKSFPGGGYKNKHHGHGRY